MNTDRHTMLPPADEFDLDVRLSGFTDPSGDLHPEWRADDATVAGDCGPTDGCTGDCFTAGCNTSETCQNIMCGSDAITFGSYCVDDSGGDDTCMACGGGPGDPPDDGGPEGDTRGKWCP